MSRLAEMLADILEHQTTEEGRLIIIAAVMEKDVVFARKKRKE